MGANNTGPHVLSTFGAVSRATVKDLSDATRLVNRLKQTEEVEIHNRPIPLNDIRTASVCDAAVDPDRPDGSTQGRFLGCVHYARITQKWHSTTLTCRLVITSSQTECVCLFGGGSLCEHFTYGDPSINLTNQQ